jgi:uncharacterized protein YjhX (UPF0386 family)
MRLYNTGNRVFRTAGKNIAPGGSIEITEEQAQSDVVGILARHGFLKVEDATVAVQKKASKAQKAQQDEQQPSEPAQGDL